MSSRRLKSEREQSFHNFHTLHGVHIVSDVNVSHNMCNDKNPPPFKSDIHQQKKKKFSSFGNYEAFLQKHWNEK